MISNPWKTELDNSLRNSLRTEGISGDKPEAPKTSIEKVSLLLLYLEAISPETTKEIYQNLIRLTMNYLANQITMFL